MNGDGIAALCSLSPTPYSRTHLGRLCSLPAPTNAQREPRILRLILGRGKADSAGNYPWHRIFFAYFPSNASGPAILGDLLSSGLGVRMLRRPAPPALNSETHVLDWAVPALGSPERFLSTSTGGGVIQDTASSATLCAYLPPANARPIFSRTSQEFPQSSRLTDRIRRISIEKDSRSLGIGREYLLLIHKTKILH